MGRDVLLILLNDGEIVGSDSTETRGFSFLTVVAWCGRTGLRIFTGRDEILEFEIFQSRLLDGVVPRRKGIWGSIARE